MVEIGSQRMQNAALSDCRSFGSSRFPKVSIGITVNKSSKPGPELRTDSAAVLPNGGITFSCKDAEGTTRRGNVETLERNGPDDFETHEPTAWFSTRSDKNGRIEGLAAETVKFFGNGDSVLQSEDGPHKKLDSIANAKRTGKGGNVERVCDMGDRRQQHSAVDDVMNLLIKANRDLSLVHRHLDHDFQANYPDHANPCKLVARIKRIQEDLVSLKDLCRDLLKEKQDLVDKATTLITQRSSLQRLLASSGLPLINESDEASYRNLNQVINEWADKVRRTGYEERNAEDINQMLFSAIVHDN